MATTEFKAFAIGSGNEVVSQSDYENVTTTWRVTGWLSGILPHRQINKVLRQSSTVAAALTQAIADFTNTNVVDNGDLTALTNQLKLALSASLPFDSGVDYPPGSIGFALKNIDLTGGEAINTDLIKSLLVNALTLSELTPALRASITKIDAPVTGLETKVASLEASYAPTIAAATSAAAALSSQNAAAISAAIAEDKRAQAELSSSVAATKASDAALAATSAQGAAAAAASQAVSASNSATTAGTAATLAATHRGSAEASATVAQNQVAIASFHAGNAIDSALAANTSSVAASLARDGAFTSRDLAASSSTSAAAAAQESATSAQASANWYQQTIAQTGNILAQVAQKADVSVTTGLDGRLQTAEAKHVFQTVVRNDGKVAIAGLALASQAGPGGTQSEVLIMGGRLVFVPDSNPNAVPVGLLEVGVVDGVTTLVVPAARFGDVSIRAGAIDAPTLAAISANLGSITAGTLNMVGGGSHIRNGQTAYDAGVGWFFEGGTNPRLSYRANNGQYLRCSPQGIEFTGVTSAPPGPVQNAGSVHGVTYHSAAAPLQLTAAVVLMPNGQVQVSTSTDQNVYSLTNRLQALWYGEGFGVTGPNTTGADFECRIFPKGPAAVQYGVYPHAWVSLDSPVQAYVQNIFSSSGSVSVDFAFIVRNKITQQVVSSGLADLSIFAEIIPSEGGGGIEP